MRKVKNREDNKYLVAEHLLKINHNIKSVKVLDNVNHYNRELNIRESIEISKYKKHLWNLDLSLLQNALLKLTNNQ